MFVRRRSGAPCPCPHEALCSRPQNTCVSFRRELKEKIQPEILELIKQQRLNRLVEGTCFRKLNCRRRQGMCLGHSTPSWGEQRPAPGVGGPRGMVLVSGWAVQRCSQDRTHSPSKLVP